MAANEGVEIRMADLIPKTKRVDAIQCFVESGDADRAHRRRRRRGRRRLQLTIGTGGPAVVELIARSLAPALIGREAVMVEKVWRGFLFLTHAASVGAITSLAPAAIDTA